MTTTEARIPNVLAIGDKPYDRSVWKGETTRVGTTDLWDERGEFRQCGRYTRYSLTFTNEAQRLEYQGPIEPAEPRLHILAEPAVISATPFYQPPKVDVHDGDVIVFAGYIWQIYEPGRARWPKARLLAQVTEQHLAIAFLWLVELVEQEIGEPSQRMSAAYRHALIETGVLDKDGRVQA